MLNLILNLQQNLKQMIQTQNTNSHINDAQTTQTHEMVKRIANKKGFELAHQMEISESDIKAEFSKINIGLIFGNVQTFGSKRVYFVVGTTGFVFLQARKENLFYFEKWVYTKSEQQQLTSMENVEGNFQNSMDLFTKVNSVMCIKFGVPSWNCDTQAMLFNSDRSEKLVIHTKYVPKPPVDSKTPAFNLVLNGYYEQIQHLPSPKL